MMSKKYVILAVAMFLMSMCMPGYCADVKKADAQYHSMCGCKSIFYYNRFETGATHFGFDSPGDGSVTSVANTEFPGSALCDQILTNTNKSAELEFDQCLILTNMNNRFCWLSGYYFTETGKVFTIFAEYQTTGGWIPMSSVNKTGVPYWNQFDYYFDFSALTNVSHVRLRIMSPDPAIAVKIDNIKICRYCSGLPEPPSPQLTGLSVNSGTLSPDKFAPDQPYYTLSNVQGVSNIKIKPVCTDPTCDIYVNGSGTPTISNTWSGDIAVVDKKTIEIRVQNKTTACIRSFYQVSINNPPLPNQDARLVDLTIEPGSVSPVYSILSDRTAYGALVPTGTSTIKVTPTVNNSNATIKVNGVDVANATQSDWITVTAGMSIPIVVKAADGVTQKSYSLTVAYPPVVNFTASTGSGNEAQATPDPAITVSVTPAPVAGQNIIVPFEVTSASSASENFDYTLDKTPLHFGPGEQFKIIPLNILTHDQPLGWDRTVAFQLSTPSPEGTAILSDPSTFVYTITSSYNIVYVNSNVPASTGDGLTWATGFTYLQQALVYAKLHKEVLQIWVARGNYFTTGDHTDRSTGYQDKHFMIKDLSNISIYGGFPTNGGTWAERDPINNPSTLTADLNSDDVFHMNHDGSSSIINNSENTGMVVEVNNCQNVVLDGFNIAGANSGTGLYENYSNKFLLVRNCKINKNQAQYGGFRFDHTFRLENCEVSANVNGPGGTIQILTGQPIYSGLIVNCNFHSNYCTGDGGGLYILSPSVEIINCTFSQNTAYYNGGGIKNDWSYLGAPSREIKNCIIWGNSSISYPASPTCEIYNDPVPTLASHTGALAIYNSNVRYISSYGAVSQNNIDVDPLFNSGAYTLSPSSECIDKGDQSLLPQGVTTDIVGNPRVVDANHDGISQVDMGCYEVQDFSPSAIRYVRADVESPGIPGTALAGQSWDKAYKYLQDALTEARTNNSAIKEIRVGPGDYFPDQHMDAGGNLVDNNSTIQAFELVDGVNVYGGYTSAQIRNSDPNSNGTNLSGEIFIGQNGSTYSIHVVIGANAIIDGFTIENSIADASGSMENSHGGGIFIKDCSQKIAHCKFINNTAMVGGGAIYSENSSLEINNTSFIGNILTSANTIGGAIYSTGGTLTMGNVTFDNNIAQGLGGAVAIFNSSLVTISGSSIFNNNVSHDSYGGALYLNSDVAVANISGTDFSINHAGSTGQQGGAICMMNANGELNLTNCYIYGNTADFGSGIYSFAKNNTCKNVLFNNNGGTTDGGGIALMNPSRNQTFVNCIFANHGANRGAGIFAIMPSTAVFKTYNCTFYNNNGNNGGGMYIEYSSGISSSNNPVIKNSIIWSIPQNINGAYSANNCTPLVANNYIQDYHNAPTINPPGFVDVSSILSGGLNLTVVSPPRCIDQGADPSEGMSIYPTNTIGVAIDMDNNPRKVGTIDIGAYEKQ